MARLDVTGVEAWFFRGASDVSIANLRWFSLSPASEDSFHIAMPVENCDDL